jgi:hypothetical protein
MVSLCEAALDQPPNPNLQLPKGCRIEGDRIGFECAVPTAIATFTTATTIATSHTYSRRGRRVVASVPETVGRSPL